MFPQILYLLKYLLLQCLIHLNPSCKNLISTSLEVGIPKNLNIVAFNQLGLEIFKKGMNFLASANASSTEYSFLLDGAFATGLQCSCPNEALHFIGYLVS